MIIDLEIKNSILFNLEFCQQYFFIRFLSSTFSWLLAYILFNSWSYCTIPKSPPEIVIHSYRDDNKEAKAEIKIDPVTREAKLKKCLI